MLTGQQMRAARAALGWSAQRLADEAKISMKTVIRLESVNGVPNSRSETLLELQRVLEAAGVEFVGTPSDRPGLRLGPPRSKSE